MDNVYVKRVGVIGLLLALLVGVSFFMDDSSDSRAPVDSSMNEKAFVVLPVVWGDLGIQMVEAGVIDAQMFESLYEERGGLSEVGKDLLYGTGNGELRMNSDNAGELLNLLWAFGLANKNPILETGPMTDDRYGGDAGRFASTGGWPLASGSVMGHYSRHPFVVLTEEEERRVERVSKNIYRPCCNNATHFPDCNHGMAMLGLLELLAANDIGEKEMYQTALAVNEYWFPSTYETLAVYFEDRGIAWEDVDSRLALSYEYSSASGYRRILQEVKSPTSSGGGSCGV